MTWVTWNAVWRDVIILDERGYPVAVYNLTQHDVVPPTPDVHALVRRAGRPRGTRGGMSTTRFALLGGADLGARAAFAELQRHAQPGGLTLEALPCASYAALASAVEEGACSFAWAPPLVAHGLVRGRDGLAIVAVSRNGATSYFSTLAAPDEPGARVRHLDELPRAHVGWVSRLSAAGYVVPRRHLAELGFPLAFRAESFHHTHAGAVAAFLRGEVDVIATYGRLVGGAAGARRVLELPHLRGARLLAVAGPIPGEVVLASAAADVDEVAALEHALLAARPAPRGGLEGLQVSGFEPVPEGFFDALELAAAPAPGRADPRPATLGPSHA